MKSRFAGRVGADFISSNVIYVNFTDGTAVGHYLSLPSDFYYDKNGIIHYKDQNGDKKDTTITMIKDISITRKVNNFRGIIDKRQNHSVIKSSPLYPFYRLISYKNTPKNRGVFISYRRRGMLEACFRSFCSTVKLLSFAPKHAYRVEFYPLIGKRKPNSSGDMSYFPSVLTGSGSLFQE